MPPVFSRKTSFSGIPHAYYVITHQEVRQFIYKQIYPLFSKAALVFLLPSRLRPTSAKLPKGGIWSFIEVIFRLPCNKLRRSRPVAVGRALPKVWPRFVTEGFAFCSMQNYSVFAKQKPRPPDRRAELCVCVYPRYALRTASSCMSASALPSLTTWPVSST